MIIEIQHETRLLYSRPVTEWLAEFRVEPTSDAGQSCRTFHLGVSRPSQVSRYRDGFGNYVHHFNLLSSLSDVRAVSAAVVETHPGRSRTEAAAATWPLDPRALSLEAIGYLGFRGPVRQTPRLDPVLSTLRPEAGRRISEIVAATSNYINMAFIYARHVTDAGSPIDDVLEKGKGVCQDFAHLMIGILRSFEIPARYVSGYIHRPNKESQSHAWVEAWSPDAGWLGVDPTNDKFVDEHFVKVAVGRDFTDVTPNKGVYRGDCEEQIQVRVETRELQRLPNLSWRDQLPPLDIPLTTVLHRPRSGSRGDSHREEQIQQQQQQQ